MPGGTQRRGLFQAMFRKSLGGVVRMVVIEPVETLKRAALTSVSACHAVISLLHPKVKYHFCK